MKTQTSSPTGYHRVGRNSLCFLDLQEEHKRLKENMLASSNWNVQNHISAVSILQQTYFYKLNNIWYISLALLTESILFDFCMAKLWPFYLLVPLFFELLHLLLSNWNSKAHGAETLLMSAVVSQNISKEILIWF